jgi:UDP-N-acetylglucosamine acyltransferase
MIHPTAIINKNAEIDEDVEIGPYSIIGEGVIIEKGTKIGAHAVIEGPSRIGKGCRIFPFASIGAIPQDLKFKGEKTELIIGDRNTFREFVTINRGTAGGGGKTVIGSDGLFMAYSHVAHDCHIGNFVIMANGATLAGHITIEDHAIIGGLVAIHQFVRIGAYAMVAGFSGVSQDIPPYVLASGNRTKLYGLNIVGLKRHGFLPETIRNLKIAYRILFRSGLTMAKAIEMVRKEIKGCQEVDHLISFIENSKRGICR